MKVTEITIKVPEEEAEAYRSSSDEDRARIDFLLSLRLREALRSQQALFTLMDEIGAKAEARGLTPEILESLLAEG